MEDSRFWRDKKVFITGHTGFKGAWTSIWLENLGAKVTGYSLAPPTKPSLYELTGLEKIIHSVIGDIRDRGALSAAIGAAQPEVVLHMAAQPLVLESYVTPVETFQTNVMGTVNVLEAIREIKSVRSVVIITTDKCYENKEWLWNYREADRLGGHDPYSSSKACAELVTASYRSSFFPTDQYAKHGVGLATARAGNVIGGGDFAKDRIIPDCLRALEKRETLGIRRPGSIRPWQHVLEAIAGYLSLSKKLFEDGEKFSEAWNFGPYESDARPVKWIVDEIKNLSGGELQFNIEAGPIPHEAHYLKLDTSKARARLDWHPKWELKTALQKIIEWHDVYSAKGDILHATREQIKDYASLKI